MAVRRRAKQNQERSVLVFVRLDAAFAGDLNDSVKWAHVATEGEYRGYAGGAVPFTFERSHFDQVVANIHAHPSFVAGPDGKGIADVVPWDFNHASEQDPTAGDLPTRGAPAQAWTRDFEVRINAAGKCELWALTRWLDPLRTYIKEGRYKWASVALTFDAIDPKTARNVGALITSIAATNTPFIEGMAALAASKGAGMNKKQRVEAQYYRGDMAEGPEDALEMIRKMLELPATAGVDEVGSELAKLQAWSAGLAEAPAGVEVDELVCNLRCIMNLPVLATPDEIFASVASLLAGASGSGVGAEQDGAGPAVQGTKETTMDLIKLLASKLGVKTDDGAIGDAVEQLVKLRKAITDKLGLSESASDARITEAAVLRLEAGGDAIARLSELLKALGVENAKDATGRIADIMQKAGQLETLMPELGSLRDFKAKTEEVQQEEDVSSALASYFGGDEKHRELLKLYRKQNTRDVFLEKYPAKKPEEKLLTQTIAGGNGGAGPGEAQPAGAGTAGAGGGAKVINLMAYKGRNRTEKLIAYCQANVPEFAKLTFDEQWERACLLGADKNVKVEGA